MFHFMFLMVDICLDIFADKDNLEESTSLSRLIQWMNPKLINKKGKDSYYQYRDLLKDVYTGLLGEFLRFFIESESLEKDNTPAEIKNETDPDKKQQLFCSLVRKFIIGTHEEYAHCPLDSEEVLKLPDFYPQHEFLRANHKTRSSEASKSNDQDFGNSSDSQGVGKSSDSHGGGKSSDSLGGGKSSDSHGGGRSSDSHGEGKSSDSHGGGKSSDSHREDKSSDSLGGGESSDSHGGGKSSDSPGVKKSSKFRAGGKSTAVPSVDDRSGSVKMKMDEKQNHARSMLAFLGTFVQMISSVKDGNGLDCFLLQKKVHKIVQATGHKNYASSIASLKQIVLCHRNPKFSHTHMWNQFAGRPGVGLKMARDQDVEHLNRYLKEGFKSLGVNLDEKNAQRINNSADMGQEIEKKVNKFYDLDIPGKSHTKKDRHPLVKKLTDLFKKENIAEFVPNRNFNGPTVSPAVEKDFDEAKYVSWHHSKTKELNRFYRYKESFSGLK